MSSALYNESAVMERALDVSEEASKLQVPFESFYDIEATVNWINAANYKSVCIYTELILGGTSVPR